LKRSRADNDGLQDQVKRLKVEKDEQTSLAEKNLADAVVVGVEASRWEISASRLMDEVRGLEQVHKKEQVELDRAASVGRKLRMQVDDLQQESSEGGWRALYWEAEAAGIEDARQKSETELVRMNKVGAELKKQIDDLQEDCSEKGWETLYLQGELRRVEEEKQVSNAALQRVNGVGRRLRKQKDDLLESASASAWEALYWEFEARRTETSKVEELERARREMDGRTVQLRVQVQGLEEKVQDKTWEAAHFEAQSKQVSGVLAGAQKELAVVREELCEEKASTLAERARYEEAAKDGAEWQSKATERGVEVEKLTGRVGVLESDLKRRESDVDRLNGELGNVQQKLDVVQKEKSRLEERLNMLAPEMQGLDLDQFRGVQCRGEEWLGRVPGMVRDADFNPEVIILKMIKGQQIELLELVALVREMDKYVELVLAAVSSYVKDKKRGLVAVRCVELLKLHGKERVEVDVGSELESKLLEGVLELEGVMVTDRGVVVDGVFWWVDQLEMVPDTWRYALVGRGLYRILTPSEAAQVEKSLPSLWQGCKARLGCKE